jgi:glycogen(starch) synthase
MYSVQDSASTSYPSSRSGVLLEFSWEVCNQVGGIYQVLRSKAELMLNVWGERYCLVGPYIPDKAATDFEACEPPPPFAEALASLRRQGVKGHFGHWLVSGKPQVILLEYELPRERLNAVKHTMWETCGVQSPNESQLVDNALSFGEVSALLVSSLFGAVASYYGSEHRVLAHFHEWQGGAAIGLLKRRALPVATLFTTHATLLGRYIASGGDELYQKLPTYNPEERATHFGILAQHQIERACAQHCTVFTTVSPITGEECTHLLGRKPDVITPNGINTERYDVGHDFQTHHAQYKESIRRFVMGHFFPSYSFDLDKTLFFFTSGRFEPHNKGFDLCLEALARLNAELKAQQIDITVVFFIVTSQPVRSLNPHAMRDRGVLDELQEVSNRMAEQFARQLFLNGASNTEQSFDQMVDEYWRVRYRRTRYALRSNRLPFSTTHVLVDEENDEILRHIQGVGLLNSKADPVKVVYHPQFINSVNPLWRIEYEQFVRGCHLGIFPSAYEPWGYTPLECVCMGVPAITSDLSGFGRYLADVHPDHDRHGVTVLGRRDQDYHSSAKELAKRLLAFCRLNRRQRIALRNSVEAHSHSFDWSKLGEAYHRAHRKALETVFT